MHQLRQEINRIGQVYPEDDDGEDVEEDGPVVSEGELEELGEVLDVRMRSEMDDA